MWALMTITVHCIFWEAFCDMDVTKELMKFDSREQCQQAIVEIHKTQPGRTLFCNDSNDGSPHD